MRKNTKKLVALIMTVIMVLALFPVGTFAQEKPVTATSAAAAETAGGVASDAQENKSDADVQESSNALPVADELTESEAPVSDEQSEAAAPQETSGNATALQKSSGLLPAPVLRYQKSSAAYIVTAVFEGEGTAEQPYLITSSADWDALSSAINSGSTAYAGKYFKLTDDITVTTMLGYRPGNTDNDDYVFSGTFDGAGHTLNVNINTSLGFAAPFAIAHNAVIKNLTVTGTVTSTGFHATGLVGASKAKVNADESSLTIQNVTVSTDVSCTSHIAGIIGHAHQANITMENVVFDGSLNASSVQGGFIGWGGAIHGFNASFKDCLFAGTYKSGAAFHPIAFANGQGTVTLLNDFYTTKAASGGTPITPTGSGSLKLVAAAVENNGETRYFDSITTAADSANWTAGSTLKLLTDVTTSSTITVPVGAHSLDLNGFGIKMTGSGSVINAGNGAALSVEDSNPDAEHKFTVSNAKSNGAGLATVNDALTSGYQTFTGGYITGGSARTGGGIMVNGTAFLTLNAGTVIGNQSSFMGAGIKADNNGNNENINITVNGGAIIYNTVNGYGAGICSDGAVEVNGGTIAYNVASNYPGGIHSHYLHLNGGRIENNFAGVADYACGAHADHEVYISGNPVVFGNLTNGTPVNLDWDRTEYRHGHKLNIVGALTEGAKIGVTIRVGGSGEFTSGWKDKMGDTDPAEYFKSDSNDYKVIKNADGEAELIENSPFEGKGTEEEPYLIQSAADWDALADSVLAGKSYHNKFFLLTEDITATEGIGSADITSATAPVYAFSGTFDGGGHTLEFVPPADANANYVAPFSIVKNATVTNLKVTGKVTAYNNISGLVGSLIGTLLIENVISDVDVSGNFVGGFIGHGSAGNITVRNSAYTGDLNGSTLAGGIICWRGPTAWDPSGVSAVHMENCLFAGRAIGTADFHPIGFTQQTNVPSGFTNMWSSVSPKNNSKGFYNYQYQGASYKPTVAVVTSNSDTSGTRPWMGYYDVTAFMPTEGALAEALNAWTGAEKLFLLGDATANTTATVPSGEHTLDLNGHELKRTGATGSDNSGLVITVGDGVNLTVTGPGKITGGSGFHGGGIHVEGNSSLVLDNCEISGNTGHYGGGLYLKNGTITLKNGTAVKNNSATEGFGGSGIYAEGSGTLILEGGTFTNNEIRNNNQYAVFLAGNANAQISGAPVIYDNKYGSTQKNLYMFQAGNQHSIVRIAGALTDGAKIGVGQTTLTGEITSGWKDKMGNANPSKYFTSDNNSYSVFLNANDEAEIGVPPAARIISGEVTTNYGSISDAVGAWTAGSTLKLLSDVTTGSTITVPAGSHTLDLNGHTLKAGSAGYSVITVGSGAALVIDDTASGGKITGGSVGQNYGGGITVDAGTLTLRGGAISGNANTYSGIGNCGGGIHVKNSGEFYMEGGEISGNTSYVGGGVCSDGSATTVSITGGVIKNNTTERFASAIWAGRTDNATFLIGGTAEIVDNISTWTSDKNGEASVNFSKLSISGNPTVRGCWKTTGNSAPNAHINFDNDGSSVQRIALDGALTNESGTPNLLLSPIYRWNDLQSGKTFVFTKNWSTYMGTAHPADYFGVDASVSGVRIIRKDGEAAFTGSSDLGDLYITYNANGGTGEMDAQLVSTTSAVLNQNSFTNGNKEFIGWNTKADGSGTPYSDKGDITLSGDVTLYAQWAEKHAHDDIDFKIWTSTTSLPTKAGDYYLGADVTISSTWNVPIGETNLCLNGHGIKMTGSGSVINVGSSAVLNVYDCGETEHKFTVNSPASNGAGLAIVNDALTGDYKTFTGGYITGGNAQDGAGIYATGGGKCNMYGGSIVGNLASRHGGGVNVSMSNDGSEFNLYGGSVCYNSAVWGGGINAFATARVCGEGLVANNVASNGGGGIELESGAILYMNGGTVTGNRVLTQNGGMWKGGGVHVPNGTQFHISGNMRVTDNYQNSTGTVQSNVFVRKEVPGKVILDGALGSDASLGIGTNGTVPFTLTTDYNTYMGEVEPGNYFTSDSEDYIVERSSAGEAILATAPVPGVSAEGFEGDYDGAAHSITVTAPTGAEIQYGTEEGSYTLTQKPSYTDAGTYTVYYQVKKGDYKPVSGSAVVQINKINATVTITGHTSEADYNAQAHSADGYEIAFSTPLYTKDDFSFSGRAEAARTNAGTTAMGLTAEQFKNTSKNFETVTFEVEDGYVTIHPIDVNVTITGHTTEADYNAQAHSAQGYDFAPDTTLYTEADFGFSGRAEAVRTDAGTTAMGLAAEQFENTSQNFATVTFTVIDGFVSVKPIDASVTITGHSVISDYDGKEHVAEGYDFKADTPLYTEADFAFSGTAKAARTDAGITQMGLSASQFVNTGKNFATVIFNVTDGSVKITPIDVTVTITGHINEADYNGEAHSADGYDVTFSNSLYTEADFTFSGRAEAVRTDAGTTVMGLAAEQFENTNPNFATVAFEITDGYVRVNPIAAVVTITGHTDTAAYNGKAHTVSGYEAVANTALYDVEKDFAFTGSANAVQTDAGTAKMGLTSAQFKNTNQNFASVIFKVTDGWQKITRVDASIKSAPHAKNNLVYSGDTQALIVPGTAVGGTLYYAIGANDTTVPAGAQFKQTLPAAKEVGNYYIWYKVAADKNHNSLAPKCFKVTLAEPAWESISGKILNNDNTPAPGAKVILMRGNEVVDTITSNENGEYYFTVPKGVYNMVVKVNGVTVTNIADVTGNVNSDITLPAPNTDSVLDIVSSDKSIAVGGLEQEASLIRQNEKVPDDVNVTVKMTVQAIAESDTDGSKAITSFAKDKYIEFYNLSVEKTVGSVTTKMNTTQTVMEIVIPCSFTNKRELQVFTCDVGDVTATTESDSGAPGTYRVDTENGLIYIYTTSFATVALAYQPYFSVTSFLSLGSYTGNVSVKLEKESGNKIFELNDVSVEDIAFKGVPRGTYTMTVQWVDGVENTITLPFNIK